MSTIPPLDLTQQYKTIQPEIEAAVLEVLASGRYIGGDRVTEFERQFADYVGTQECIACNSGTDALYLVLRALDIGTGDEVITTPFTFFASSEVISLTGATPVFVDIDAETYNLDADRVEAAITDRTKAILPVHLFGQPANLTTLSEIARDRDLVVIEDCAQATGATWNGRQVGSVGRAGCFSFFPTKNLAGFGDGGAVTTDDAALAQRLRALKNHGSAQRYYHEEVGINSRLDTLQAAILSVKLHYLDRWNDRRRTLARRYSDLLGAIEGITVPRDPVGGCGVWNQYTIRLGDRDRVRQHLQVAGISSAIYYPLPLHWQPAYKADYASLQLPIVERVCQEVLSLPMFPELGDRQQEQVVYALKDCWLGS